MNKCRKCDCLLTDENWFESLKNRGSQICKTCNNSTTQKWRSKNPDMAYANTKRYHAKNPGISTKFSRDGRLKLRQEMIKSYGGECLHCGINDIEVLDIDHINNNGGEDRKKGIYGWKLYRFLKKNNYPKDDYQLLCKNCNWKKELARRKVVAHQIFKAIEQYEQTIMEQEL